MSIPSNIAEGCVRSGDTELARFRQFAMDSESEVESNSNSPKTSDSSLYKSTKNSKHLAEVKRMLNAFIQKLNANC